MEFKYKYGLLLVDVSLIFKGKTIVIENMVVDTGAARTLISQNAVEEIGLGVDLQDRIVTYYGVGGKEHAFRKRVEEIEGGEWMLSNMELDFNDFGYDDINGLLGLDLLMRAGYVIDLLQLKMTKSN